MKASLVVEVDPDLLAAYVDEIYDGSEHDEPKPAPQEFLVRRLQEVAADELPIALWGWTEKVGMTITVEETSG